MLTAVFYHLSIFTTHTVLYSHPFEYTACFSHLYVSFLHILYILGFIVHIPAMVTTYYSTIQLIPVTNSVAARYRAM